jgi:hypothetical protein
MLKRLLLVLFLSLGLMPARDAACVTISFQNGSLLPGGGTYFDTQDTEIQLGNPDLAFGTVDLVRVDALFNGGDVQGLLAFENLFGVLPGQIPFASTINSAVLTLDVFDSSNVPIGTFSVYRLTTAWDESSTWNSLTGGIQIGSETVAGADDAHTVESIAPTDFDVQASLQAWSGGASNFGWLLTNDSSDGVQLRSSEYATVASRPLLTVDYTSVVVPEPASLVLVGFAGAAALGVRRLRRPSR